MRRHANLLSSDSVDCVTLGKKNDVSKRSVSLVLKLLQNNVQCLDFHVEMKFIPNINIYWKTLEHAWRLFVIMW